MELSEIVDRIEEFERKKQEINDEVKFIYQEAKLSGYNTQALKKLIRSRKKNKEELEEEEKYYQQYKKELDSQLSLFDQPQAIANEENQLVDLQKAG